MAERFRIVLPLEPDYRRTVLGVEKDERARMLANPRCNPVLALLLAKAGNEPAIGAAVAIDPFKPIVAGARYLEVGGFDAVGIIESLIFAVPASSSAPQSP